MLDEKPNVEFLQKHKTKWERLPPQGPDEVIQKTTTSSYCFKRQDKQLKHGCFSHTGFTNLAPSWYKKTKESNCCVFYILG